MDWSPIKYFKREEWVKDPDRVHPELVFMLDEIRGDVEHPIQIHVAWDASGHVEQSAHYTTITDFCTAVDFHIEGLSLLDQWLFIEKYPLNGIGLYPYWKNPGLHIDLRKFGKEHSHCGKRWWRDKNGIYQPFDRSMIKVLMSQSGGGDLT